MNEKETETVNSTIHVYYDDSDPQNCGWAYRCADHSHEGLAPSGQLDGFENEQSLTEPEAHELALQAFVHDSGATHVAVYYHGESPPIVYPLHQLSVPETE